MAIFLPELDTLFVHIPKAGGTWVKSALAASGLRCEPARGVGQHGVAASYANPGKRFAFVRHPLAWIESAWKGLHVSWPNRRAVAPLHREKTWSPIRMLTYLAGDATFDGFVETLLVSQRSFVSRMFEWYVGPPGYPAVDFVGRQEYLRDDLQTILEWIGWDGQLADIPPENVACDDVKAEWNHALKIRFLASESPAISRFYHTNHPGPWRITID